MQLLNTPARRNLLGLTATGVTIAGVVLGSLSLSSSPTEPDAPAEPQAPAQDGAEVPRGTAPPSEPARANSARSAAREASEKAARAAAKRERGTLQTQQTARQVHVLPRHAKLWLDGQLLGTGTANIQLQDEAKHELRVAAPGYLPERVHFSRAQAGALEDVISLSPTRRSRREARSRLSETSANTPDSFVSETEVWPPTAPRGAARGSRADARTHLRGNEAERAALGGTTEEAPQPAARPGEPRVRAPSPPPQREPQAPDIKVIEVVRPSVNALD